MVFSSTVLLLDILTVMRISVQLAVGQCTLAMELCPLVRHYILKGTPKFTFLRFKHKGHKKVLKIETCFLESLLFKHLRAFLKELKVCGCQP
jgi:hypothetical protein